jgi:hypothetical protein
VRDFHVVLRAGKDVPKLTGVNRRHRVAPAQVPVEAVEAS